MLRNKSLAYKLSFFILSSVLFSVLLILFVNYEVSKKLILKNAEQNASHLTQSTVQKIENILLTAQKIPENLSYIFEHSTISPEKLNNFLKMVVETNDEIYGSCIAFEPNSYLKDSIFYAPYYFKSGKSIFHKSLGNADYNYFDMDWYKLAKKEGAMWSEPYFDQGGGNIIMSTYSVPFYRKADGNKEFWGVVTADVSLKWLDSLMANLNIYESGYAFLLSETGIVITHPETHLILNQTIFSASEKYNRPDLIIIGNEMIAGKTAFIPYKSMVFEGKCRLYYAPLPINNWSIGLIFLEKELFADLNNLATWLLILGGISLMALFIIIVIISRNITSPIRSLAKATQQIGTGHFNVKLPHSNSNDEISLLTKSFADMQQQLHNYIRNLEETTAAKKKIESELKIAHDIQQGIIPKIFPPIPQREDVDIYAVLNPAKEVGGDLYDFFYIDKNLLAFAIGDVSGKGVPASLFMAITVTLLRAKAQKELRVNEIVQSINTELCRDNVNSMFVTFFLGIVDLNSGELNYCNAGHNYPYILRQRGELQCLDQTHGTPLGLYDSTVYKSASLHLKENENIILFTDGITEAMDKKGEMFGDDGLEQLLKTLPKSISVKEIVDKVVNETKYFARGAQQSDDITLLALSCKSTSSSAMREAKKITIKNKTSELSVINNLLMSLAEEWHFSNELLFDLNVVLEEVLSNIILYAYDDKQEHEIEIELKRGKELSIKIEDDGREFNPMKVPPPENLNQSIKERKEGGLGIHFVKTLMDKVEYERKNNRNILMLKKKLMSIKTG